MIHAADRAAVLLLCAATFSAAAEKDPWLKISTPHFDLFTTAGEHAGRELVKHFEQVHSFFLERFRTGITTTRKARVILFRSEKEYEPYRPNDFAAAFYHPGEYHDAIVMTNAIENARPVAVHELTHLMFHQIGLELPQWLNEGLAELYSNLEARGSQVMVGRDIPARMRMLATGQWIGLRTLLAVDRASEIYNDKFSAAVFYAESWKLVHMLSLHPDYAPRFPALITALRASKPETAFRSAYGKSLDEVEHDARVYLSGGSISAVLFNIALPKDVDAPVVETRASLPARLAIAEMLSTTRGRYAQARAEYEALSREFPSRWEVAASQGLFAWHERNLEGATGYFQRAEDLGCRDGTMFLLWGRVLVYGRKMHEAVAVLARAAELLNQSDEAQLEYGNALALDGQWAGAVGTLRTVKTVPPSAQWRYHYNLAYGLYRTGDVAGAKESLAKARQFAAGVRENSPLDELEKSLNRRQQATGTLTARDAAIHFPTIEGALEKIDCGSITRLHVRVAGAIQIFLIPDLKAVHLTGGNGERVDLDCGAQKAPRPLRIEYEAMPGTSSVAGIVHTLEFR